MNLLKTAEESLYGRKEYAGYDTAFLVPKAEHKIPFITLYCGEGHGYYSSGEAAIRALRFEVWEYIKDLKGHIHWRTQDFLSSTVVWFDESFARCNEPDTPGVVLRPRLLWGASCRLVVSPYEPSL